MSAEPHKTAPDFGEPRQFPDLASRAADSETVTPVARSSEYGDLPPREVPSQRGNASRVARNFLALTGADLLARAVSFLVLALVARRLGPGPLGWLATGQLAAVLAPPIVDWGVSVILVRDVVRGAVAPRHALELAWGVRLVAASAWSGALLALLALASLERELALVILAFVPFGFSIAFDPALLYQAREDVRPLVVIRSVGICAYGILGLAAVEGPGSVALVAASLTATHLVGTIAGVMLLKARGLLLGRPALRGGYALARTAAPVGIALLSTAVMTSAGIFWLAVSRDAQEVGQYNAALRILVVGLAPTSFFGLAALPRLTSEWGAGEGGFSRYCLGACRLLGSAGFGIVAIGLVFASPAINLLYGPGYEDATTVLQVLLLTVAGAYLAAVLQPALVAIGRERRYVRGVAGGAILTVVLSWPSSLWAGAVGVAAALFVGQTVMTALLAWPLRDVISPRTILNAFATRALGPFAVALGVGLYAGIVIAWPVALTAASGAYLLAALLTGAIRAKDSSLLRPLPSERDRGGSSTELGS